MTSFQKNIAWIEKNFIEVMSSEQVHIDLKYASTDNFMNRDVYQGFQRCFLAPLAFEMFLNSIESLRVNHPDLQFVIWDALRPRQVQSEFFSYLKGSPFQDYVANPFPGSLHNFGMAIDLGLRRKSGRYLDMGTEFDEFTDMAQPVQEEFFRKSGILKSEQLENRWILRSVMENNGFKVLPHEWWHFNALPKEEVYGKFPILE